MFWPKVNWKFPDYFCVLILLLLMLMLFLFWIKLLFRFVYCVIDVVVTVAGSRWLLSWIVWFKCRLVVTLKRTCVVRILRARMSLLSSFFNFLLTCSLPIDLPICRSVFSLSRLSAIDFHREICFFIPSHAIPTRENERRRRRWKEQKSRVCQNLLHAESLNGKRTIFIHKRRNKLENLKLK